MKTKDLFSIALKILGLLVFKDLLNQTQLLINPLLYLLNDNSGNSATAILFLGLFIISLYSIVGYFLLFRTVAVLKLLKLDETSQQEFSPKISKRNIISISLIVTAALILIDQIPAFCSYLYNHYEVKRYIQRGDLQLPTTQLIFSAVKILIALLLIGERKRLTQFLIKEAEPEIQAKLLTLIKNSPIRGVFTLLRKTLGILKT